MRLLKFLFYHLTLKKYYFSGLFSQSQNTGIGMRDATNPRIWNWLKWLGSRKAITSCSTAINKYGPLLSLQFY